MKLPSFLPSSQSTEKMSLFRDWINGGVGQVNERNALNARRTVHWAKKEVRNGSIFSQEIKDLREVPSVLPSFFPSSGAH
jgi:hypothetical protein